MGFPSNDFGNQEPGSNAEIAQFCESNYGVRFPMFTKVKVKGVDKIPLYRELIARTGNGLRSGEVGWNFEKFLIDRQGRLVGRFSTPVEPRSPEIVAAIEKALAAR
jgi:glutathione peroxidase